MKIYEYSYMRQFDSMEYKGLVEARSLREAQRKIERVKGNAYVYGTLRIEELARGTQQRDRVNG